MHGRPMGGFVPEPTRNEKLDGKSAAVAGSLQNKVDHFNASHTAVYSQRYWYNDQWYKPGGPVFLIMGGESAGDTKWIEDDTLEWAHLAVENGAFVFLLEHRYYGQSRPTPDMTSANLIYLSSAQAIEDMAVFIPSMKQKFPQLATATWATMGGSYAGTLAVWARVKHPELVSMAVGSAAAVQAEVDFVEYLEVVQAALTRDSPQCAQSVSKAFNLVSSLLKTASGRQSLKATFSLCEDLDPTNEKEIEIFWMNAYSPYMEVTQYSGNNAGLYQKELTIHNAICRFHDTDASSLTKLQQVISYYNHAYNYYGCIDIGYQSYIDFMRDTTYGSAQTIRAWVYQQCTEFGYFKSTGSATAGPFFGGKSALPAQFYIDECTDIYGSQYNSALVAEGVAKVNAYYGGRDMQSSYIILPNGSIDPWHALGKVNSTVSTIVPVVIEGSAHCADLYTASLSDSSALSAARQKISGQLKEWLQLIKK